MPEFEELIRDFLRALGCRPADLAPDAAVADDDACLARLERAVHQAAKRLQDEAPEPIEVVRRAVGDEVVRSGMLQLLEPHRPQVPAVHVATLRWIWQSALQPTLRRHRCTAEWLLHGTTGSTRDDAAEQELGREFLTQRVYPNALSVLQKCAPDARGPAGLLILMARQFVSELHRRRSPLHARAYDIAKRAFELLSEQDLLPDELAPMDHEPRIHDDERSAFEDWIEHVTEHEDELTEVAVTNLREGLEAAAQQMAQQLAETYHRFEREHPTGRYAPSSWVQALLQTQLAVAIEAITRQKGLADDHDVEQLAAPRDDEDALDTAQLQLWVDELLSHPNPEARWNERVEAALQQVISDRAAARRQRVFELHRRVVAGLRAYLRQERVRRPAGEREQDSGAPDPRLLLAAWLDCLPSGAEVAQLQGEFGLKKSQVYQDIAFLKEAWTKALVSGGDGA